MMRDFGLLRSSLGKAVKISTSLSTQPETYRGRSFLFLDKLLINKRSFCLLTSLCLLLSGCDSGSAASSVGMDSRATHNTTNLSVKNDAVSKQDTNTSLNNSNTSDDSNKGNVSDSSDGQSLMSIAKTDNGAGAQQTPMISERRIDSTLQATLIGNYKGILPCSFCAGINMTLDLISDGSVLKTSIYENPEVPKAPLIESGVYRQDDHTITVVYDDKSIELYRIENNHLIMLDDNKKPNPDYTLSRK